MGTANGDWSGRGWDVILAARELFVAAAASRLNFPEKFKNCVVTLK